MAVSYCVKPSSGDSYATIFSNSSLTKSIGKLNSGTALTVMGQAGSTYKIKFSGNSGSTSFPKAGKVTANSGLNIRSAASTSGTIWGTLANGTSVEIDAQSGDWWHIRSPKNGYVSKTYITLDSGGGGVGYISHSDVKSSSSKSSSSSDSTGEDGVPLVKFTNYSYSTDGTSNDEFYKEFIEKIQYTLGTPPKYNMDIDVQYESDIGIGRVVSNTIYSNPTLLSICPGKVQMFPGVFGEKKDQLFNKLLSIANGNSDLASRLNSDSAAALTGQMYKFAADTAGYAKRLNVVCRACAVLMGIGDKNMPKTSTKLKNFDYAYWTIRKAYTPSGGAKDQSIFKDFWNAGVAAAEGAVTDKNYVHFMVSNNGTSISENIGTTVDENALVSGVKSSINGATSTLSYFLGSGFTEQLQLEEALNAGIENNNTLGDWAKLGKNMMKGGQMVFPKQISGVDYSQSLSCDLTFVSPYGDPLSVFLWCVVPILHILTFALPKQVADNMYTFPFICRVCQKGWYNSNLAVISDVQIRRGGSDDTSWTHEGLATEWNVTFSVVPLLDQLMITSSDNPFLFIKNDSLIDYLGNLCAFDLKANNMAEKGNLFRSFLTNKFTGIPNDLQRYLSDYMSKSLSDIFNF